MWINCIIEIDTLHLQTAVCVCVCVLRATQACNAYVIFVDSNCDELQLESALIESISQKTMAQSFAHLCAPCDFPA